MRRKDVYSRLDLLREQHKGLRCLHCAGPNFYMTAEEWFFYLEKYFTRARAEIDAGDMATPYDDESFVDLIEKITSLGVACMEQHSGG